MRVAIVIRDLPRRTGFGLVVENLLLGLANHHAVRLFILQPGYYKPHGFDPNDWPYEWEAYPGGTQEESSLSGLSRASRYYKVEKAALAWLNRKVAEYRPDRIVGFDYNMSPYLGMLESSAPKILNVVDSEIRYFGNQILSGNVKVSVVKHLIAAVLAGREHFNKCAALITVSPADTNNLRRWTRIKNAFTVPNGVDHLWYAPNSLIERKHKRVVFTGSLSFLPNIQAIDWFVARCWRQILRRVPDAELLVIGKNPPADLVRRFEVHRGIQLLGQVDDIRPHILSSTISIAPMVSGTGIKNKILEAWALATPVVATRWATRGLTCEHGKNIVISDSAAQFAGHVVRLLLDPDLRARIGKAGRTHAIENYDWNTSRTAFKSIVESAS